MARYAAGRRRRGHAYLTDACEHSRWDGSSSSSSSSSRSMHNNNSAHASMAGVRPAATVEKSRHGMARRTCRIRKVPYKEGAEMDRRDMPRHGGLTLGS